MTQAGFATALLDPDLPVPAGLTDPAGRPAGKRFSVYRNNVAVSLTEALRAAFPVTLKIVGDEFFDAMAGVYLRAHLPQSPLMMFYGESFPSFLEGFGPVAHLGYLPDIARLERAVRQAYHAADAPPVTTARLQALSPAQFLSARLQIAPAVRIVSSRWPIHAIWRANREPGAAIPVMAAEDVLVTRPGFDPHVDLLPPGGATVIRALADGKTVESALDQAGECDLTSILGLLFAGGAITQLSEEMS